MPSDPISQNEKTGKTISMQIAIKLIDVQPVSGLLASGLQSALQEYLAKTFLLAVRA